MACCRAQSLKRTRAKIGPPQEQADLRPITDQNGARCLSLPRTAHHRGLPLLLAQVPISLLLGSVRSNTLRAVARGPPLKRGLGLGLQSDPYGSPSCRPACVCRGWRPPSREPCARRTSRRPCAAWPTKRFDPLPLGPIRAIRSRAARQQSTREGQKRPRARRPKSDAGFQVRDMGETACSPPEPTVSDATEAALRSSFAAPAGTPLTHAC
jgi:hypothetical protein